MLLGSLRGSDHVVRFVETENNINRFFKGIGQCC